MGAVAGIHSESITVDAILKMEPKSLNLAMEEAP